MSGGRQKLSFTLPKRSSIAQYRFAISSSENAASHLARLANRTGSSRSSFTSEYRKHHLLASRHQLGSGQLLSLPVLQYLHRLAFVTRSIRAASAAGIHCCSSKSSFLFGCQCRPTCTMIKLIIGILVTVLNPFGIIKVFQYHPFWNQ